MKCDLAGLHREARETYTEAKGALSERFCSTAESARWQFAFGELPMREGCGCCGGAVGCGECLPASLPRLDCLLWLWLPWLVCLWL